MEYLRSSGNETVDRMASIRISGNMIPHDWYKSVTKENGKPHLLAITILADIVYWYRPVEVRDEYSGEVVRWQKKFADDYLQKSYQNYADFFGESKRSVKAAFDLLEDKGLIRRIFRDIAYHDNATLYNVMFVALNVDKLIKITFLEKKEETVSVNARGGRVISEKDRKLQVRSDVESTKTEHEETDSAKSEHEDADFQVPETAKESSDSCEDEALQNPVGGPAENCTPSYKKLWEGMTDFVGGPSESGKTSYIEMEEVSRKTAGAPTSNQYTNTENTAQTTRESTVEITGESTHVSASCMDGWNNSIYPSENGRYANAFGSFPISADQNFGTVSPRQEASSEILKIQKKIQQVRENIEYDRMISFWEQRGYAGKDQRERYQNMFSLIQEILCMQTDFIKIGGVNYPAFHVKDRFMALRSDHLNYVMDCIKQQAGRIRNIREYTLKALYSAPATMESYYIAEAEQSIKPGSYYVED